MDEGNGRGKGTHMRVIRTAGACALALAVTAVTGIGVASASAEEYPLTGLPEIGRCVKATGKTGRFNHANCIGLNKGPNKGEYNWLPGPDAKGTIKIRLSTPTFETVAGNKIRCSNAFLTGEYLNGKEVKITSTVLQGCLNVKPNKICFSNILEPGTIESNQELIGEIGFIPNVKHPSNPFVGVDLKSEPESLPVLAFNCGEELAAEAIAIEGSVIGRIKFLNKMLKSNGALYSQKAGKQIPESFIGGVKDTLVESVTAVSEPLKKTSEQVGFSGSGEIENGEAIEIKAKQH
jgi:hypothetical protein